MCGVRVKSCVCTESGDVCGKSVMWKRFDMNQNQCAIIGYMNNSQSSMTPSRKVGKVLLALMSLALIATAYSMVINRTLPPGFESLMPTVGMWVMWLGVVKVLGAIGLWIGGVRRLSALVLTGYLGGAIMANLAVGVSVVMPGVFLIVLWIALELYARDFLKLRS
jgi:hypothetical protein